jgi:protein transport protein SEC31
LWDPRKVLKGDSNGLVLRANNHSGPVRGLHFNPKDKNLLASGATDGEVFCVELDFDLGHE